ncbi:MAG TPA: 1-acyl-sn-glycerol-3-phosphate acyltransferase, partial [Bacteroidia bacterium]|nr:1-acyl-sn-glycerol-3-phosphate acyltransferase [Bacteroidia bacterium]
QNAFLDAILVTCSSPKCPWYMTRADEFKNSSGAKLLSTLQMLPVYRFRDGYSTLKNNDKLFNEYVSKLNQGETLIIFAEGNHGDKYHLRKLQKGFARIAYSVKPGVTVNVVPVGIQYDSHTAFRSRVLISFGKPVPLKKITEDTNSLQLQFETMVNVVESELKKMIIHIELEEYENKLKFLKVNRKYYFDLHEQLHADKKIISEYPSLLNSENLKEKTNLFHKINRFYFSINSFAAKTIIHKLILPNFKDPQFIGSIKFASGMILVPLFAIIQSVLLGFLSGSFWIALLYLCSIPLSLRLSNTLA